ncbi:hypothetical protein [Photobacterium lipolyticum]|uniref:Uncharacterized protein n=1 Tax=Photobacterium lipolyticum TaxID=266810 RepID=A0A2T3N3E7_9GAMM|nr:hypothetical protein [Photobacterium lipolyticum]PSW06814.1 hypothetical protein C9I89_04655 [Photobacterium lipolyticum]
MTNLYEPSSDPLGGDSALACSRLLLQLAGVEFQEKQVETALNLPLKKRVNQYGKVHRVNLSLSWLNYAKISSEVLPLAYR